MYPSEAEKADYVEKLANYQTIVNQNFLREGLYQTDLGEFKREYETYLARKERHEKALNGDWHVLSSFLEFESGIAIGQPTAGLASSTVFPGFTSTLTEWLYKTNLQNPTPLPPSSTLRVDQMSLVSQDDSDLEPLMGPYVDEIGIQISKERRSKLGGLRRRLSSAISNKRRLFVK